MRSLCSSPRLRVGLVFPPRLCVGLLLAMVCAVGCVHPPAPSPPPSPNFNAPNLGTDPDAYRQPDPCNGPNCPRRPWRR